MKPHRWTAAPQKDETFLTARCPGCGAEVVMEESGMYYLDRRRRGRQPDPDCDLELARTVHGL